MESNDFDALAKSVAASVSRRGVVGRFGAAGIAAALAAVGATARSAQKAEAASAFTCQFNLQANVRVGPDAGELISGGTNPGEVSGLLTINVAADGDISSADLKLPGGKKLPAVGRSQGRELNVRFDLGAGQTLVGFGLGAKLISDCSGKVDGLLTGPKPGDLGDWHAIAKGGVAVSPTDTPVPIAVVSPTSITIPPTKAPGATVTPSCVLTCPPTQVLDPVACTCGCASGQTLCGSVCSDLQTDAANCGACGSACGSGQPCVAGVCHCLYGADTCLVGYVWRDAFPGDHVCVTGDVRTQAATDNAAASSRVDVNCQYGVDACQTGYVWRDAFAGDHVCVTGDVRSQAAADNAAASSRVDPGGAYGPDSCVVGYVWREASSTDHVCVTGDVRSQAAADNAAASSRVDVNCQYGVDACITGYVWRDASATDHVCVTGDVRTQAANDNSQASARFDPVCHP